jgi:hypothetical protein
LVDVVVGTVDGVWPGAVSGVFFGPLVGAVVSVLVGSVVVEETIDGTIVLVEEVAVVVDDGTDVEEAAGKWATALPATPRYSQETVMVGREHVAGHGKTTGKSATAAVRAVALQLAVLAAATCQSVPAGWPVPS